MYSATESDWELSTASDNPTMDFAVLVCTKFFNEITTDAEYFQAREHQSVGKFKQPSYGWRGG